MNKHTILIILAIVLAAYIGWRFYDNVQKTRKVVKEHPKKAQQASPHGSF